MISPEEARQVGAMERGENQEHSRDNYNPIIQTKLERSLDSHCAGDAVKDRGIPFPEQRDDCWK